MVGYIILVILVVSFIVAYPFSTIIILAVGCGVLLLGSIWSFIADRVRSGEEGIRPVQKGYGIALSAIALAFFIVLGCVPTWREYEQEQRNEAERKRTEAEARRRQEDLDKVRRQIEADKNKQKRELANLKAEGEKAQQKNSSNKNSSTKKSSSSYTYGPDEYDSYEDYMDDAWGYDFDDWDDADSYWEDW